MSNKKLIEAAERVSGWREDPVSFVIDNFGVEPDHWQEEALIAFVSGDKDRIRIAMKACAGVGKSAVLAWCAWLFLSCYGEKGEHPKGVAISVTWDNLRDNLWVELSKWQQRSEFLSMAFTWTKERIFAKDHPETWFLSARSFPKTASKEELGKTLSGMHGKYVAFFIDESGAIPVEVAKACEQAVGEAIKNKGFIKVMQAGNPLTTDGMLYHAANSINSFVITITGDPDNPKRSNRIDEEWAREQIAEHGRDDPWVMVYILGLFPKTAISSLLSIDEVEAAMERTIEDRQSIEIYQKIIGVDVALGGLDSTVIFPRQGKIAFPYVELRSAKPSMIASRVITAKNKWKGEIEYIDDTGGFGSGVIDSMRQAGFNPIGVHFSEKSGDMRYFNKRSEMYFRMSEWVKNGGCLPKCPKLKKQLTELSYSFDKGKFKLNPKKELGKSPDQADALALTFTNVDVPRDLRIPIGNNHRTIKDYDPFE